MTDAYVEPGSVPPYSKRQIVVEDGLVKRHLDQNLKPIQVEFTVYGRDAAAVEQNAIERLLAFAGGRDWHIETLSVKPSAETVTGRVISWEAEVIGRVGK